MNAREYALVAGATLLLTHLMFPSFSARELSLRTSGDLQVYQAHAPEHLLGYTAIGEHIYVGNVQKQGDTTTYMVVDEDKTYHVRADCNSLLEHSDPSYPEKSVVMKSARWLCETKIESAGR